MFIDWVAADKLPAVDVFIGQKECDLPLNVFHQFETAATRLDLVDRAGGDLVDQFA